MIPGCHLCTKFFHCEKSGEAYREAIRLYPPKSECELITFDEENRIIRLEDDNTNKRILYMTRLFCMCPDRGTKIVDLD